MAQFIRTIRAQGQTSAPRSVRRDNFMGVWLSAGALAGLSLFATACGDPDLLTDLDSEGPPEVLGVAAATEAGGTFWPVLGDIVPEQAIYCADSGKVNSILCPDGSTVTPVADAPPLGWQVRVVFSELLDPDVEELIDLDSDGTPDIGSIATTQPVDLTCGGTAVAYDGYYHPSGNSVSFPPGPSLVVVTDGFNVASGTSDCSLSLKTSVTDKDGNSVSGMSGPFTFGIATMKLIANDPADEAEMVDPTLGQPLLVFNAPIDITTLGAVTVNDGNTDIAYTATAVEGDDTSVQLIPDGNGGVLAENTTYTVTVPVDVAATDTLGGEIEFTNDPDEDGTVDPLVFSFTTGTVPSM